MRPIRLVVTGTNGMMSSRLHALADANERFERVEQLGRRNGESSMHEDLKRAGEVHLVIDFTNESGARHALSIARAAHAALLVGTTGLSRGILDAIEEFSRSTPVMIAPNTSLGAAILNHIAGRIAHLLDGRWDIDLLERHRVDKRDAPSGTALRLIETIERESGFRLPSERVHCIRAGDIVGDHEIEFTSPQENIKIFHKVTNRDVFAHGALEAATWLQARSPGLYDFEDFLGLTH